MSHSITRALLNYRHLISRLAPLAANYHGAGHINGNASHYHSHGVNSWSVYGARRHSEPNNSCATVRRLTSWGPPKKPVVREKIEETVLKLLADYDKVDTTILSKTSHFANDLGLDSLDAVEIVMMIEDEFKMEIGDADAERLLSVPDVVDYLVKCQTEAVPVDQCPPIEYQPGEISKY